MKESSADRVQDIVVNLFPTRIATFSRAVAAQKSQLLPYLIAVRMAPVLPSWFVNLAAPILQVDGQVVSWKSLLGLLMLYALNVADCAWPLGRNIRSACKHPELSYLCGQRGASLYTFTVNIPDLLLMCWTR